MTELDRLPPDQRAVLSLVLERGKSYGEVAAMLAIPESAVRDRAHAALDALAHDATSTASRPPASARVGAGDTPRAPETGPTSAPSPSSQRPRDARVPLTSPSSRTGGALLLGAIAAVIVVAVILISSDGGGKGSSHTSTTPSSTQSTSSANAPHINKTITLSPLEPTVKANGIAYVLSDKGRYAFYVAARNLPPSSGFFYAVWLYNSPSSAAPLGRAPTVSSDGSMAGGGPLPTNANFYHQLIITHETSTHPRHPGPIVLRGTFGLH